MRLVQLLQLGLGQAACGRSRRRHVAELPEVTVLLASGVFWPLAFAAYNCGEGRVSKLLRARNGRTFDDIHDKLPAETRMYVPKIAALVRLRENADLEAL